MVSVKWDKRAITDLDSVDFIIAQKIVAKVSWLAEHYEGIIPELLHYDLRGVYKLRVGDYRVLYNISNEVITIKMIDHRSRIYKIYKRTL